MQNSGLRFRSRSNPLGPKTAAGSLYGVVRSYNSSGVLTSTENVLCSGETTSRRSELTWDENHPSFRKLRSGPSKRDIGGAFVNVKAHIPLWERLGNGTYSTIGSPAFVGKAKKEYTGFFCNPNTSQDGIMSASYKDAGGSVLALNPLVDSTTALESQAWNIRPKFERGQLANALYELRELPQQLRQTAKLFRDKWRDMAGRRVDDIVAHKVLSDQWLATEFGWIPFINDVSTMCDAVIFSKQYIRDISSMNNTWIKRKATLVDTLSMRRLARLYTPGIEPSGEQIIQLCKDMTVDGQTVRGFCDIHLHDYVVSWAEGEFKFYRPEFDRTLESYSSFVSTVNRYITLYGARITPTHIWKAIPWTWAIDWFTNIGKLIERADAQFTDSTVSKFLYLMHHRTRIISSFHTLNFWSGVLTLRHNRFVETKQRRRADSPYGFVLGKDLSPTQWSILIALGISRNVNVTRTF